MLELSYDRTFSHNVFKKTSLTLYHTIPSFNPLPRMPILGSSNSVANKDMMSKIWTNGNTTFWLSRKHCVVGKEEIAH